MPAKEPNRTQQPATSSRADIQAFLGQVGALDPAVKAGERGRLIFALDATMSRQPTWDQACQLQAEMFREAASVGGLDLQLVYYRGLAECRASGWVAEPDRFGELMSRIDCRGGQTQIAKVLAHARRENDRFKVGALVFIGDAMEENLDELCGGAGELGLRSIPAFTVVARRLLPVRAGRGARTCRIVTRGGGLCGGRHEGARGPARALDRRDQADRADEMTCPRSSSVLSFSSCCCLPLIRFPRPIPSA
jgi:hypothetical protein